MKHILIIDDEIDTLEVMSDFLDILGYLVTSVDSINDALESIKTNRPDLVITDLIMPDNDGFCLIKKVKENYPQLPVYVVSGVCSEENINKAINQGADKVFSKPLDVEQFETSLEKLFMIN